MGYKISMMAKPKCCLTCQYWNGERKVIKAGYPEAECADKRTRGQCGAPGGYLIGKEATDLCKSFEYWDELK